MLFRPFFALALTVSLLFTLSACGGGGGGSSSGLYITTNSLSFSAVQFGSTPATQDVGLSFTTSEAVYVGAAYGPGVTPASWLDITVSGSGNNYTFYFHITDTNMAPGNYGTTVGLGIADGNGNIIDYKNVSVSYTVLEQPTFTPSVINFNVGEGVTPEDQSIVLDADSRSSGWDSTITYTEGTSGWLTLTPSFGDTFPQTITFSATSMPVGVYKANVGINVDGSLTTIPVLLTVNQTGVNFVSPYAATTGVAGDVIIRGYGFTSIANPAVMFGGQAATAVDVISDTEIHASYPALSLGTYAVTVENATQTLPTRANLVVVNPTSFPYTAIPRINAGSGGINNANLIFDAERNSIYLLEISLSVDRVEMYRFNGASWDTASIPTSTFHNLNSRIVLSPDGSEILKSDSSAITHIDTATFAIVDSVSASSQIGSSSLNMLSMTNDGGAIGNFNSFTTTNSLYKYDILTKRYFTLHAPFDFINRQITSPANGSKAVLTNFAGSSTSKAMYEYDASTGQLVETSVTTNSPSFISFDTKGNRLILPDYLNSIGAVRNVYDADYNLLGTLPDFNSVVASPDGTKAYTYVSSTNSIHVYDLNTVSNGEFVEIGTGTVLPDSGGGAMRISGDGNTLIMAGSQNIIVMPVP